jgi:hypothetical protein
MLGLFFALLPGNHALYFIGKSYVDNIFNNSFAILCAKERQVRGIIEN